MTWVDVNAASTSWAEGKGYVLVDYVEDDYVIGHEPSGPWTDEAAASTTWTDA
jgi:hypothetical protein